MRRRTEIIAVGMFLLAISIVSIKGQNSIPTQPKGDWRLMVGPSRTPTPVDVFSVTTEAKKALTTSTVKLKNHTNLRATAVKLHWSLFETKSPSKILLEGDTPLIEVSIAPGSTETLNYNIVSFAAVCNPLLINGELNGSFRIEIKAVDVNYTDQSGKQLADSQIFKLLKVNYHTPAQDDAKCADQGCQYNVVSHQYECVGSTGAKCSPSADKQSCTESRCGSLIE